MPAGRRSARMPGVVAGEAEELGAGVAPGASVGAAVVERDPRRAIDSTPVGATSDLHAASSSAGEPSVERRPGPRRGRRATPARARARSSARSARPGCGPPLPAMSGRPARSSARDDQARGGEQRVARARRAASCRRGRRGRGSVAHGAQPRRQAATRRRTGAPARCEVAALVDVQLDEAAQARPPLRRGRRAPSGSTAARPSRRVAPSSSHPVEHVVDVEAAGQRPRPERRRVEARALLVGERDDGHRSVDRRRHRERRRDTERAVVAPALRARVSVCEPVAHHGPSPSGTRPAVARRIALDAQPDGLRPAPRTTRPPPSSSGVHASRVRRPRRGRSRPARRAAPRARRR